MRRLACLIYFGLNFEKKEGNLFKLQCMNAVPKEYLPKVANILLLC
jgi:hypothetical protein